MSLIDYAQQNSFDSKPAGYLEIYEKRFGILRDRPISILELGVARGKSMEMWSDCFRNATIAGIDLLPEWEPNEERVRVYRGRQDDIALLNKVAAECAPQGFDIIVDDAAHIGQLAKASFWHLFTHHLKSNAVYAIEDWGTGYWGNHVYYPDGDYYRHRADNGALHWFANKIIKQAPVEWPKLGWLGRLLRRYQYTRKFHSHPYGMVGFVKQLVDEIGMAEITSAEHGVPNGLMGPTRGSRFKELLITPGVILVTKA